MKHRELAPTSFLVLLLLTSAAAGAPPPAAQASRPEVVRLLAPLAGEATRLQAAGYDVLAVRPGEWIDLLVAPEQTARLRAAGYAVMLRAEVLREVPEYFHTYAEMLPELQALVAQHPDIARLEDVGDAWGRVYALPAYPAHDLWAVKISDHPHVDEEEPVILYFGTQHGREPAGVEIGLAIIDSLVTGYGVDPQITRWVDEHETWVMPLVNPDGHWCCHTTQWRGWRKNARDNDGNGAVTPPYVDEISWYWPDGVDLNRNSEWFWGTTMATHDPLGELYCGPAPNSEPETQALQALILRERPVVAVDYHAFGEYVLWPFGHDDSTTAPDDAALVAVGTAMAARVPAWAGGTYLPMQAHQVYAASGTISDWAYGTLNTFAFTVETCTWLYPGEDELAHTIAANVAGAFYLQERVDGAGLRGRLTAAGAPVEGTIVIEDLDDPALSASRRSHPALGDYCRLLAPGVYDLRFEAQGWAPVRIEDVVVPAEAYVTLNVEFLDPAACDEAPVQPAARLRVRPSPALLGRELSFAVPATVARIEIVDCLGRIVARLDARGEAGGSALGTAERVVTWRPDRAAAGGRLSAGIYLARPSAADATACRFVLLAP